MQISIASNIHSNVRPRSQIPRIVSTTKSWVALIWDANKSLPTGQGRLDPNSDLSSRLVDRRKSRNRPGTTFKNPLSAPCRGGTQQVISRCQFARVTSHVIEIKALSH